MSFLFAASFDSSTEATIPVIAAVDIAETGADGDSIIVALINGAVGVEPTVNSWFES